MTTSSPHLIRFGKSLHRLSGGISDLKKESPTEFRVGLNHTPQKGWVYDLAFLPISSIVALGFSCISEVLSAMGLQQELEADHLNFNEISNLKGTIAESFRIEKTAQAVKAKQDLENYLAFFEKLVQKKVNIQDKTAFYRYFHPDVSDSPKSSGSFWQHNRWNIIAGITIGTLALLVGGTAFALTFTGFLTPLGLAMNAGGLWLASIAAGVIGLSSTAALGYTFNGIARYFYQTKTRSSPIPEPENAVLDKLVQLAQQIYTTDAKVSAPKVLSNSHYRNLFTHGFLMKVIPAVFGAIATIALMFDAATGILSFPAFSGGIAITASSVLGMVGFAALTLSLGIWMGRKIYQKMVRDEQREWFAICKQRFKLSVLEQLNSEYITKLRQEYPHENLNQFNQTNAGASKEQAKGFTFSKGKGVRSGIIFIEVFGISISSIVWGLITICGALNFGLLTITLTSGTFILPIIGLAIAVGIIAGGAFLYSSHQDRLKKDEQENLDKAVKDQSARYGCITGKKQELADRAIEALRAQLLRVTSSPTSSGQELLGRAAADDSDVHLMTPAPSGPTNEQRL